MKVVLTCICLLLSVSASAEELVINDGSGNDWVTLSEGPVPKIMMNKNVKIIKGNYQAMFKSELPRYSYVSEYIIDCKNHKYKQLSSYKELANGDRAEQKLNADKKWIKPIGNTIDNVYVSQGCGMIMQK